jgi:hypothetical protein
VITGAKPRGFPPESTATFSDMDEASATCPGRAAWQSRTAVPGRPLKLQAGLGKLDDGTYTVSWRAVSRVDGHVTRGAFAFSVGAGQSTTTPAAGPTAVPAGTPGPVSTGLGRTLLLYWGFALLVGQLHRQQARRPAPGERLTVEWQ